MASGYTEDTLVIGAGQAGLAVSRCLQRRNVEHAVLERGRVANSWRTQRWDSFHLNTPNRVNLLPGDEYDGDEPTHFAPGAALIRYFDDFRRRHGLPVEENVEVTAVRPVANGFEVQAGGRLRLCRNVIVSSGDQNVPRIPTVATLIPEDIVQLHAGDYRSAAKLPDGATLVVGSAQSGVQITEDLLEANRAVYLCTSPVARIPRRYRGRDTVEWLELAGFTEQRPQDLEDPSEVYAKQGQVSGTHGGHTVSLQQLARDGVTLLGRLAGMRGRVLTVTNELPANIAAADESSAKLKAAVDMFIAHTGMDAPQAEADPVEAPFDGVEEMAAIRELDLDRANIRSVIWATGFGPEFDFLPPELLDARGYPRHSEGVCEVPGLYCLGFVWLRRRISGLVAGVATDAEHIAALIAQRSGI